MHKQWFESGGWGVSGTVEFSREASCWTWVCAWGCWGWDCEGREEARQALLAHKCSMDS